MDEPSLNENSITRENFADIASEQIHRILCFPGNEFHRTWAVKFLQKAARGFGLKDHEQWLNALGTVGSSEVILSNCKSLMPKFDFIPPSLNSSLSFVLTYPLQFNLFIAALASLFISQIEDSQQQMFCVPREEADQCKIFHAQKANDQVSCSPSGPFYNENANESRAKRKHIRNVSNDSGPFKKNRMVTCGTGSLNIDETIRFLEHVWRWARTGHVKMDADLLGDVLFHLPESVEEVVLSWAKEMLRSNQGENGTDREGLSRSMTTTGLRKSSGPSDDDVLQSLSVLHDSPVFLAAAASSPKLFQRSSSMLNQLLIQASGCSCSWSSMLSLCKMFAQETAKGRPRFYPTQVQPLILLVELDPNTLSSNEHREFISSQLSSMFSSQPTEVTVAVLSHFPSWLQFLDHAALL